MFKLPKSFKLGSDELQRIEKVIDSFLRRGKQENPPTFVVMI
jgi:hypothetical protein